MSQIKIACIGDSLTWGYLTDNQETDSYPAVLGKRLGEGYHVRNFGVNGHTLSKDGDTPYWDHPNLKEVSKWLPDLAIIMLGTNDAKPRNWKGAPHYRQQYLELIDYLQNLSKVPKIVVNTIPTAFPMNGHMTYDLLPEALAAIPEVVKGLGLPVIDVGLATQGRPDLFPEDGVHTSTAGAKFIAETVFEHLF